VQALLAKVMLAASHHQPIGIVAVAVAQEQSD
jgi:hypothetical protein